MSKPSASKILSWEYEGQRYDVSLAPLSKDTVAFGISLPKGYSFALTESLKALSEEERQASIQHLKDLRRSSKKAKNQYAVSMLDFLLTKCEYDDGGWAGKPRKPDEFPELEGVEMAPYPEGKRWSD
jgi:hypothetical protein